MTDSTRTARVALVTGASQGIGAATAIALGKRGIDTVLAVRSPAAAEAAADAVRALGVRCSIEACDVSDYRAVERCVAATLEGFGRLDIVVNNAGQVDPQAPIGETDPAAWVRAVTVNLAGPYHLIRAALPALLERRGAVVNVSTGAAHTPRDGWSAYCSSKAGLFMLSRSLVAEYGRQGLSVFSLQPGLVDTSMQARIRSAGTNEISRIPQEKLAPPSLSAAVIAWLADAMPQDLMGTDLSVADAALLDRAGVAR